ncbi:MBL fold metallo-hydrolase [Sphingobium lignivorans]|uniref:Phosphoribosyl 1,2-cyclic phosphate phosphodiesterase n=1 Tax=Sphingobium lignivorans TaxID=2735886 RepID=A0ABR6NFP1_9SPHN|nr:MBL fold metallo-hydrolase [Sphingobium lignivorans]MBB5985896.1 phosphoribosyl 1,2-cyclic phosphate phosphodiesterase [Sphingobium lignivorans]
MTLRLLMLGSGTSSGVPRIGGDWGACDPSNPRNRRSRVSILVESATTRILVDTSPDMRAQLLAAQVAHLDAVLWTHDHADHVHGIDDLRQVMHQRRSPVPGYAHPATLTRLRDRFDYVFQGANGYRPTVAAHELGEGATRIGDILVSHVAQPHGAIWSSGFRFDAGGRSIAYATDFHEATDAMLALYADVDCLVIDTLRRKPHPSHAHLDLALEIIARVRAKRAILTHMDQSLDYAVLAAELPEGVEPGYDGLVADV